MSRFFKAINPFRRTQSGEHRREPDSRTELPPDTSAITQPPTINVVLFGETGVGKSSVINLIAQGQVAEVSSDVEGCTMQSTRHDVVFDGLNFAIFDTIGLETPRCEADDYLNAIEKAFELVMKLSAAGGIHLLLFCMRGGKITATARRNYRFFWECLCSTQVPIALVFTGLEREDEMEDWWKRNEIHVEHCGMKSDGHACIAAVVDDTPGEDLKFIESQKKIRELLKNHALRDAAFVPETYSWFAGLDRGMKDSNAKHRRPKKKAVLNVLTKHCKLDPDTAKKIAEMIEKGGPGTRNGSSSSPPTHDVREDDGVKKDANNPITEPVGGLRNNVRKNAALPNSMHLALPKPWGVDQQCTNTTSYMPRWNPVNPQSVTY